MTRRWLLVYAVLAIGLVLIVVAYNRRLFLESGVPAPSATPATIRVAGDALSGASAPFTVTGTGLSVTWTVTAPTGGCAFRLILTTPDSGLVGPFLGPTPLAAGKQSGQIGWNDVGPGTFILEEDRSGFGSCDGSWSGEVTPQS